MKIGKYIITKEESIESISKRKESNIINTWIECWEKDDFQIEQEQRPLNKQDEPNCFHEWLITTVDFLNYKIEKNKIKNDRGKAFALFCPSVIAIAICLILHYIFEIKVIPTGEVASDIKNWIVPSVLGLWLYYVTSKWIGVKKYQETWARCTKTKSLILSEMLKYICRIEDYSSVLRKPIFIKNILVIVNGNVSTFHENMTQNEESIFSVSEIGNLINNRDS